MEEKRTNRSTEKVVAHLLDAAIDGISLTELKSTNGRQRRVAERMIKAGYFENVGVIKSGLRCKTTIMKTHPNYSHLSLDEITAIASSIDQSGKPPKMIVTMASKEPKSEPEGPRASKPKITPEQLKRLIQNLKKAQDQFADSKMEVGLAEAALQELYLRHEELGQRLGTTRDEVRRVLPRTEGDVTFQFEDGSIYHVDFGVLTVVEIKPIQL